MNTLMALLPPPERAALLERCARVELALAQDIYRAGDPIGQVLFPITGYVSLVTTDAAAPCLEVGMIGSEGMLGGELLLGAGTTPWRAVVQGAGTAWSLADTDFHALLAQSPALQRVLKLYLHVRMAQFATAAPCQRFHAIGPRLARWLLMMHDRSGSAAHFHATHEFLSFMLGVRRPGVTVAAGELQGAGFVHYSRGEVTVLDRAGLEQAACGCYALDRATYATVMRAR